MSQVYFEQVAEKTYLPGAVVSPVCRPDQADAVASGSPVWFGTPPPDSLSPPSQQTRRCPPQLRLIFPLERR